jgi:hypothetical protein
MTTRHTHIEGISVAGSSVGGSRIGHGSVDVLRGRQDLGAEVDQVAAHRICVHRQDTKNILTFILQNIYNNEF